MDLFKKGYIEAMFFFSEPSDENLKNVGLPEISAELMERIEKDCAEFLAKANHLISDENCNYTGCTAEEIAGQNFFLTRNGHGCGYTDGYWNEPAATKLDELASSFKAIEIYVGDDGMVYA